MHEIRVCIERASVPTLNAGRTLHLPARGLRQPARVEQHDGSGRFAAGQRDRFGQRGSNRGGGRELPHVARYLGRDTNALCAVELYGKRGNPAAPHQFHLTLDRQFEILRIEVAPPDDQQVLQASCDIEVAVMEEAQIAGAQPAFAHPISTKVAAVSAGRFQ